MKYYIKAHRTSNAEPKLVISPIKLTDTDKPVVGNPGFISSKLVSINYQEATECVKN